MQINGLAIVCARARLTITCYEAWCEFPHQILTWFLGTREHVFIARQI